MPNGMDNQIWDPGDPDPGVEPGTGADETIDPTGGLNLPPCEGDYYFDPESGNYYSGAGSYFDEPCNPSEGNRGISWSYKGRRSKRTGNFLTNNESILLILLVGWFLI